MASRYPSSPPSPGAELAVERHVIESLSPAAHVRFARQILMAGVGCEGQARVLAATAQVAGEGFAHRLAERYALRAGFASVSSGSFNRDALAPREVVSVEAARDLLAGARAALRAFRAVACEPGAEPRK